MENAGYGTGLKVPDQQFKIEVVDGDEQKKGKEGDLFPQDGVPASAYNYSKAALVLTEEDTTCYG